MEEGIAKFYSNSYEEDNVPIKVKAVPRLLKSLEALSLLFGDNKTALRLIRGTVTVEVLYTFGDSSGSGFGASWTYEYTAGLIFGVWNEEGDGKISNYREFRNLVETLEDIVRNKGINGSEVFLCTDNMVYESVSVAGSSRSETIYDLVVRLHCLCMRYMCQVRFIHVSGTRMIGKATKEIYIVSLYEGFMNGKHMF